MPHSLPPRLIRKYPCSPQYGFQEFATVQYLTPPSTPQPTMRTAWPPSTLPETWVVDARHVVGEVGVDSEGGLDGAAGHDGLLDALLTRRHLGAAGEGVLVRVELALGVGVALAGALRGRLLRAALAALRGVRVGALGAVV